MFITTKGNTMVVLINQRTSKRKDKNESEGKRKGRT